MKKPPHEVLKVSKRASKRTIKKAYRALVLTHHPDRGGNRETFEEVQAAYDELNGETSNPDNAHVFVYENLSSLFLQTLAAMDARHEDPSEQDVLASMESALTQTITAKEQEVRSVLNRLKKLAKVVGRFTVKDDENIFERTLANTLREGETMADKLDTEIEQVKACKKFLAKCKYRFDAKKTNGTATNLWRSITATSY